MDSATTFDSGTYSVSEVNDSSYTATYSGDCDVNGSVTVTPGSVKSCTITNEEKPTHLTVKKIVINHGQNKSVNDFGPFTVDAQPVVLDASNLVDSGVHSVAETVDPNYTQTFSANCANGSITLTAGDNETCTITNEEKLATVVVHKVVINHGLSNDATHFAPYKVGTTEVILDAVTTIDSGTYSVTEVNDTNYTATYSGDCDENGSVTVTPGSEKSCTITNEEKPAKLIVTKVVVTDNGGTAVVSSFPLSVDATSVTSGDTNTFNSGAHVVSEVGSPGYTAVISGDCDANGNVNLVPDTTKTCTITNDDKAPSLTLVKEVKNDNGGTAIATDWNLSASGPTSISGDGGVVSGATFSAGTYTLSESTGPAGYVAGQWTCVGGTQEANTITLALGQSATCTIVNDDQPGILRVIKLLPNDNGGTATVDQFFFSVNGGLAMQFEVDGQNDMTVNAGVYSIVETTPMTGYAVSYNNCSQVVVANGGEATCTVTNDDQPAHLILVKHVVNNNGGTATISNFTPSINNGAAVWGDNTLNAGQYIASETNLPGYTASVWGGDCAADGSVTLVPGETKTCEITNDDIAPRLTVIKHVINDSGDVALASDFTMVLTGTNLSSNNFAGSEAGVTITLNAGSYTANELVSNGYVKTLSADCSGTIAVGETKTCTITNNDIPHPTRTQGFWQTHTTYTTGIFNQFVGGITIGGKVINTPAKLFAGFYSNLSKTSTGAKRTQLDQARMQMLQQWLAAKLNCQAFGCSGTTQTLLANAATAWTGTDRNLILSYASQLDAYNNSNDALSISGQGKATPGTSQTTASSAFVFWNVLP